MRSLELGTGARSTTYASKFVGQPNERCRPGSRLNCENCHGSPDRWARGQERRCGGWLVGRDGGKKVNGIQANTFSEWVS